jgi:SNF2 family DNA or RNA helicase
MRDLKKSKKILSLHAAKIEAVQDLIDELWGKPVLIAYHYKHDLDQLLSYFSQDTPYLGSKTSGKESAKIVEDWNAQKIPVLLGHPQSMSHGLNMQRGGQDIIWFSLTDNLENYLQFNRRIYRHGVTGQVRIHHILAENTIDIAILKRLNSKNQTQAAFLDAIKEYRKNNDNN